MSEPHAPSHKPTSGPAGVDFTAGLLALTLGIAVQMQQPELYSLGTYALGLGLAWMFLGVWRVWRHALQPSQTDRQHHFTRIAVQRSVVWLAIAVMGFGWTGLRAAWFAQSALPAAWQGMDVHVTGIIAGLPRGQDGVVRFRFAPESAQEGIQQQPIPLHQMLEVAWYRTSYFPARQEGLEAAATVADEEGAIAATSPAQAQATLRAGDRWSFTLRLRQPNGLRNPGMFDYEKWLWQEGVQATAYVRDAAHGTAPTWQGDSAQFRLDRMRQHVRDRLLSSVEQGPNSQDRRTVGILAALVTGDQRSIAQADWDIFRITGVAHLMAISGVHITMFAWLAMRAVGWCWRRSKRLMLWQPAPTAALWGGLILACAYAVFSGWQVPAQRTVVMLAVWVFISSQGVRWPWHATLALAAWAVLLMDPWALQQAGFWLSFVAVGVLLNLSARTSSAPSSNAAPLVNAQTKSHASLALEDHAGVAVKQSERFIPKVGRQFMLHAMAFWQLQWRLTLLLVPLTVCLFGQISWTGLLANLLAIPLVTFVITPLAMVGVWLSPALDVAAWAMGQLMQCLSWMAQWPYATVYWPNVPWYWAGAGLLGALVCIGPWPRWLRVQGVVLFVLMLAWRPAPIAHGEFAVLALDIGQGGSMLVQTRQHALLFDAGPSYGNGGDAGQRVVVPALQQWGITPNVLVLSHNDSDHTGGANALMQAFPAMQVFAPFPLDAGEGQETDRVMARCHHGARWLWDGVTFEFLYPSAAQLDQWFPSGHSAAAAVKPPSNATSCVLKVSTSAGVRALFTGDIGRLQELELRLNDPAALKADWLQIPHHGSRSSSTREFIETVAPRVAIAQAGYGNRFGHPHPEVLKRYDDAGVQIRSTPQCGAIQWESTDAGLSICERIAQRRYWQRQND